MKNHCSPAIGTTRFFDSPALPRFILFLCGFAFLACAHPISENFRSQVDKTISFGAVLKDPGAYIGEKVVLGGIIIETRIFPGRSEVEVVQKDMDRLDYPEYGDLTGGRFIFTRSGFLEPEIYAKGRAVTGGGKVVGHVLKKIGSRDYEYPVIEVEELYLWGKVSPYTGYDDPYYWDPYYRPLFHPLHLPR